MLFDSSAHPCEVRRETVADRIKFVRDALIGLAEQRVIRGMNQCLMEFRIHPFGLLDIISLDRKSSGCNLLGYRDREPFGVIRK